MEKEESCVGFSNRFSLKEVVKSWFNELRHGRCSNHSFELLQSRMLCSCRFLWGETPQDVSINILTHPWICSMHIVGSRQSVLICFSMIEFLICSNTWLMSVCIVSLPCALCMSFPPTLCHTYPLVIPLEKTRKYQPPEMTDPESVFSFPRD